MGYLMGNLTGYPLLAVVVGSSRSLRVLFVDASPFLLGGVRLLWFYRIVMVSRLIENIIEVPNFFSVR